MCVLVFTMQKPVDLQKNAVSQNASKKAVNFMNKICTNYGLSKFVTDFFFK